MDFAEAWDALAIGGEASVKDGTPPPSANTDGHPYKCWQSHNFTGTLAEKIDGPRRAMRFDLPPNEAGSVIGYTVIEGVGHNFT